MLYSLYLVIDAMWVGRLLGYKSLAAVSACFPLLFLLFGITFGLGVATNVFVAQSYGSGKEFTSTRFNTSSLPPPRWVVTWNPEFRIRSHQPNIQVPGPEPGTWRVPRRRTVDVQHACTRRVQHAPEKNKFQMKERKLKTQNLETYLGRYEEKNSQLAR